MGLCKCPKRRVTVQFCFEHRVNVCDYCVVTNHSKCIVQTYMQWLQDSDYNPICELCSGMLSDEECIRLTCYHVFHWKCLNDYAKQFPLTTSPSGYVCPSCKDCLFPASNVVSPVAEVLREKLASVNWARAGLGLPLLIEKTEKSDKVIHQDHPIEPTPRPHAVVNVDRPPFKLHSATLSGGSTEERRPLYQKDPRQPFFDHDENKYMRRSAYDWFFRRWMSIWRPVPRGRHFFSRYLGRLLVAVFAVCILVVLLSWLGSIVTRDDPNFDIHNNPNVHVESLKET